jgi:hypothetical protein
MAKRALKFSGIFQAPQGLQSHPVSPQAVLTMQIAYVCLQVKNPRRLFGTGVFLLAKAFFLLFEIPAGEGLTKIGNHHKQQPKGISHEFSKKVSLFIAGSLFYGFRLYCPISGC